jgi:hypothetical protein
MLIFVLNNAALLLDKWHCKSGMLPVFWDVLPSFHFIRLFSMPIEPAKTSWTEDVSDTRNFFQVLLRDLPLPLLWTWMMRNIGISNHSPSNMWASLIYLESTSTTTRTANYVWFLPVPVPPVLIRRTKHPVFSKPNHVIERTPWYSDNWRAEMFIPIKFSNQGDTFPILIVFRAG